MSEPIVSTANLDNKSAAEAIIDCAREFFASITLEDLPNILKDVIDNLKYVGKQVIDKIKDFILNDFWGLIIDSKDIIKSFLNQQWDKALNCASRAMDKLEKVLDVLSYIPCLSVTIGVILIVIYICQLDFAAIASAAICMLSPLKIVVKIFPKSKQIINKLVDFLVDFGKRFKDQAQTSLKNLFRKCKVRSAGGTTNLNYDKNYKLLKITERAESPKCPKSIDESIIDLEYGHNNIDIPNEKSAPNFDSNIFYGINTNNTGNKGLNALLGDGMSSKNNSKSLLQTYNYTSMFDANRSISQGIPLNTSITRLNF